MPTDLSPASARSRVSKAGSTADSSSSIGASSTTSTTTPSWSVSRSSDWRLRESWSRTATRASGPAWTPTRTTWTSTRLGRKGGLLVLLVGDRRAAGMTPAWLGLLSRRCIANRLNAIGVIAILSPSSLGARTSLGNSREQSSHTWSPSVLLRNPKVVLVHDYLVIRGGAERALLALTKIFPDAPIYTSVYRPETTLPAFAQLDVRPLWSDRLPGDAQSYRTWIMAFALAFEGLRPRGRISSSPIPAGSRRAPAPTRTSLRLVPDPASLPLADGRQRRAPEPARSRRQAWPGAPSSASRRARCEARRPLCRQLGQRARPHRALLRTGVEDPLSTDRHRPVPANRFSHRTGRLLPARRPAGPLQAVRRRDRSVQPVGSPTRDLRRRPGSTTPGDHRRADGSVRRLRARCGPDRALLESAGRDSPRRGGLGHDRSRSERVWLSSGGGSVGRKRGERA